MKPTKDATEICRLNVVEQAIAVLTPFKNNARTHSSKQIKQIAESITEFGWTNPVLVDAKGGIIAGHGRLKAAKVLGMSKVPTICLDQMSKAQKRAYVIADNKLAENAGWDTDILAVELEGLLDIDIDFDVTITGFEMGEIDNIIGSVVVNDDEAIDVFNSAGQSKHLVAQRGDLWLLGDHRIYCGDALKEESWNILMSDEKAQMVFTDPPYNVKIDGHVSGLGKNKHDEFAMACGEMSKHQFTSFLHAALKNLVNISADGAIHYVCMDWRHMLELLSASEDLYSELKNICVWNKNNGGMGSLYRSKHELIAVLKVGRAAHINNVELGKHGRYRTNVWDHAGVSSFGSDREKSLEMHPTVKPVALVEDAILDCSDRNGIIVDAFLGSGTTILAAERAGRRGFGMELDPKYVDVALRRWRELTGEEPVHASSGLAFKVLE